MAERLEGSVPCLSEVGKNKLCEIGGSDEEKGGCANDRPSFTRGVTAISPPHRKEQVVRTRGIIFQER